METVGLSAHADQLHAELRAATPGRGHSGCDALDPCDSCQAKTRTVRVARRVARVAAATATEPPRIPVPRAPSLQQRLARKP